MKSTGKKIKHKLQVSHDTEILFLGLVTPDPDYKTSLLLNSALGTRFQSRQPLIITSSDNTECNFSRFSSVSEFNDSSFELVRNRNGKCIIDKKLSGLDYLLLIRGSEIPGNREDIISRIRATRDITAVFVLDENISLADNILQQIT